VGSWRAIEVAERRVERHGALEYVMKIELE